MIEPVLDISRWQGNISAEVLLASDARGLMIRLGSIDYNGPYEDYLFRENDAKFDRELPCGYYWFFRPEYGGRRQGEYVVERLVELNINPRLPVAIDVEQNLQNVSSAEFWYEISEFVKVLRDNGFFKLAIYTRGLFWNANLGMIVDAAQLLLWIARYNSWISHPWEDCCKPFPWEEYWGWQWSADGNGLGDEYGCDSDSVDLNKINMTETERKIYTAEDVEPDPSLLCRIGHLLGELSTVLKEKC